MALCRASAVLSVIDFNPQRYGLQGLTTDFTSYPCSACVWEATPSERVKISPKPTANARCSRTS